MTINEVLIVFSFLMWTAAAFIWGMVFHRDYYSKKGPTP